MKNKSLLIVLAVIIVLVIVWAVRRNRATPAQDEALTTEQEADLELETGAILTESSSLETLDAELDKLNLTGTEDLSDLDTVQ